MDEKDHIVSTFDGEKVGIRLFLKDKNLPTILFFHGNAELAQEYDDLAEFYNKFEMNFILVFQNHLKTLHIFKLCSTFYDNVLRSCS